jgi:hypothetical protein
VHTILHEIATALRTKNTLIQRHITDLFNLLSITQTRWSLSNHLTIIPINLAREQVAFSLVAVYYILMYLSTKLNKNRH